MVGGVLLQCRVANRLRPQNLASHNDIGVDYDTSCEIMRFAMYFSMDKGDAIHLNELFMTMW